MYKLNGIVRFPIVIRGCWYFYFISTWIIVIMDLKKRKQFNIMLLAGKAEDNIIRINLRYFLEQPLLHVTYIHFGVGLGLFIGSVLWDHFPSDVPK